MTPQHWPFSLDWLPRSVYLVGGCVRDALRRQPSPYLDLDFVLDQDPIGIARRIAQQYHAGFVVLDEERQIARVVFADATADFALQVGDTLVEDLHRRDFTVNAIAFEPHTQTLIDPLQGYADLQQQLIRMVHPQNLAEDPLRLLRAYRQASQLNFSLDPATRCCIQGLVPRLTTVAAERVRMELSYLLHQPHGTPWLVELWRDGLLRSFYPDATATGLGRIAAMDTAAAQILHQWPALATDLHRCLSDRVQGGEALRRTLLATAKLVGLVAADPQQAKQTLQVMKYSRAEIQVVTTLLQAAPHLLALVAAKPAPPREQYFLFQTVGNLFPALVVFALALGAALTDLNPWIAEYLNPSSPIAHPKPLITGNTLMAELQLRPSPIVGRLLQDLAIAQAEGRITTPTEALDLAKVLCQT